MIDDGSARRRAQGVTAGVARWSTGFKLFLLLSLALLPLALIVMLAALQSAAEGDVERRQLRILAIEDVARQLGLSLASDVAVLREATGNTRLAFGCDRTRTLLATGLGATDLVLIPTGSGRPRCTTPPADWLDPSRLPQPGAVSRWIDPSSGRLVTAVGGDGATALVSYPSSALALAATPDLRGLRGHAIAISAGAVTRTIVDELSRSATMPRQRFVQAVPGAPALRLELLVDAPRFQTDQILLMLLPLVMWLAAAGIGWLVVHRLLLRPLTQLRSVAAQYRPGDVIQPLAVLNTPAKEIGELAATFATITEMVATHEGQMAQGLDRQRRLTREVHHRVKNNLQVVASLINIHARGARGREASDAYSAIQRRVDALAVVHRNHYAEIEVNLGVALRPLLGELTANLRATAPPEAAGMTIQLDIPPLQVSQDVAVPIAFLTTELIEQVIATAPRERITVTVAADGPLHGRLTIMSPALVTGLAGPDGDRRSRVVEGLARQLRSTLDRDPAAGSVSLRFGALGPGSADDMA